MPFLKNERLSDFKGNSSHWRKRRLTLPANYSACSRTKRFSWWPCARGGRWGGRREQERPGRKVCRSAWHVRCVTLQRRRDRYIAAGDGPERSSSTDPSPPHHDT